MKKILIPIVVLVALVATVVALEESKPRADFVLVHGSDLFSLDPQRMSYQHDLRVAKALYEPLASIDANGRAVPAAARSWTVSPDGLTWTFHLRDGLRFSNGDPVTSADFEYAWRRGLLPDSGGPYSSFFRPIKGVEAFTDWRNAVLELRTDPTRRDGLVEEGRLDAETADAILGESAESTVERTFERFDEMVGIETPDDRTLVVELESPVPYFTDYVAFGTFCPVHRPTLERATSIDPVSSRLKDDPAWTKPGRLIGNGPFILASWRYQRDCRLERNPYYWNDEATPSDAIDILVIEDPNTAIMAFLSGEVDWLPDVISEQKADLMVQQRAYERRHAEEIDRRRELGHDMDSILASLPAPEEGERRDLHAVDAFGTDYFHVNCRPTLSDGAPNPLADPGVRRALALSVDKQAISERVTRVGERPATAIVPPDSIAGYRSPAGLSFDPERARRELEDAGWTLDSDGRRVDRDGAPFPTIEILYSTGSPRYRGNSLALRDMWRRELGLSVEVRGRPGKDMRQRLKGGDFMVSRGGWFGDYGDPTTFLELHRSTDSGNYRGYANPEVDRLLAAASVEADADRRFEMLSEAERILVEQDLPVIPICTYRTLYMYDPARVRGITRHPRLEQHPARWSTAE